MTTKNAEQTPKDLFAAEVKQAESITIRQLPGQ